MKFIETAINGAFVIEPERIEDERGFFARTFCGREFEARGLEACIAQCSTSYNRRRGALRGMHYQVALFVEAKLVRRVHGAIYDVILDLRPDSEARMQWSSWEGTIAGEFCVASRAEAKLVRCTAGAIIDVVVDLRPGSAAYRR